MGLSGKDLGERRVVAEAGEWPNSPSYTARSVNRTLRRYGFLLPSDLAAE